MSKEFYDKPTVFVSVGKAGRMIKIRPISGGPKKLFTFENYRLEFSPKQGEYRDSLLAMCEEGGDGFPIQPIDRRKADIIAAAHARAAATTLNAAMNNPRAEGTDKAALLSIAANMLRQGGQTPESVAEALGMEVQELYDFQQSNPEPLPPGASLAMKPDDNVADVESVTPPQIHVVKPGDGGNPLAAMLSGGKSTPADPSIPDAVNK